MEEPLLTPSLTVLDESMQSTAISRIVSSPHVGKGKSQLSLFLEPGSQSLKPLEALHPFGWRKGSAEEGTGVKGCYGDGSFKTRGGIRGRY